SNSFVNALIPKTQNANMVKDFRPISLIGSLYKIIAKILANHLVVVLGDIVSDVKSAFVADKQILDGPSILNDLIQWCKSKKKQTMIFKVDFEKAFDSVRWDYLDDVLKKFGFDVKEKKVSLVKWNKVMASKDRDLLKPCMAKMVISVQQGGAELEQFNDLVNSLVDLQLSNMQDRWFWSLSGTGDFLIASVRQFIDEHLLFEVSSKFCWRKIVLINVNILTWKVKLDVLPTQFNLSKRGLDINSILCPSVRNTPSYLVTSFLLAP
nr:cysteine-rich receptor-like protein kinase [Tanacetum cinerariifolium]